jgi:hypothetical protein
MQASGGSVTTSGKYKIYSLTASGKFVVSISGNGLFDV